MNDETTFPLGDRQLTRRQLVGSGTVVAVSGMIAAGCSVAEPSDPESRSPEGPSSDPDAIAARLRDNVYTRVLGVRPHLGAHEHVSSRGGGRMSTEVMDAIREANDFFVDMDELGIAAGRRIAEVMGAEDALVTSGGFSAMILGAAACLTGTDHERIEALPHVTWAPSECAIPRGHRFVYERAYSVAGARIVEIEGRDGLENLDPETTAFIAALAVTEKQTVFAPPLPERRAEKHGPDIVLPEEVIEIGKRVGIPVLVDMASDMPPASNLTRFIQAGADLVVVSGGKGIGGPQSTGILAGRRDLIAAARASASPNDHIGRGMKVGKEEIVGLVVALNRFVETDHEAAIRRWNDKARWLADQLAGIPGLRAEYGLNTMGYADVDLSWDEALFPLTSDEVREGLMEGDPRVSYDVAVRTRLLRDGEEVLVARRIREFFESRARG